jgi:thiosulfate reductase cytochrome b subunit
MKREYIYQGFERFWHWTQAALILFLAVTGFEIHGSLGFFGFEQAVRYHSAAALCLLVLIAFAVFWHLTTGQWRQYVPTRENLRAQAEYYLVGIFRNAPHPTRKTALSKLNPLQRLVYLGLKLLVIPISVTSGLLYMFYRYPQSRGIEALNVSGLAAIAVVHTAGAFLLVAFLVAHLYLITTGRRPSSNLKAMITGWEDLEDAPTTIDVDAVRQAAAGTAPATTEVPA